MLYALLLNSESHPPGIVAMYYFHLNMYVIVWRGSQLELCPSRVLKICGYTFNRYKARCLIIYIANQVIFFLFEGLTTQDTVNLLKEG